jgi:hypothetical protein
MEKQTWETDRTYMALLFPFKCVYFKQRIKVDGANEIEFVLHHVQRIDIYDPLNFIGQIERLGGRVNLLSDAGRVG